MTEPSRFARSLFAPLPARYDQLAEILSFHQNERWRLAAVAAIARGMANGGAEGARGAHGAAGADAVRDARLASGPAQTQGRAADTVPTPGGAQVPGVTGASAVRTPGSTQVPCGKGAGADRIPGSAQVPGRTGASAAGAVRPLILDVASGTAGVAIELARRTGGTVVGVDLTEQMLRRGAANVAAAGAGGRVLLVGGQAERLPFADGTFDALAFSYLLRYVADPQATLTELGRVVRPGGVMASLEFCVPAGPVWRPSWLAYTRLVLPVAGLVTGGPAWWRVGRFLGPSISRHYAAYPVEWTVRAWEKAGFCDVGVRTMSLGGGLIMWGNRSGDG